MTLSTSAEYTMGAVGEGVCAEARRPRRIDAIAMQVRLKADTTYETVRLNPGPTYGRVRLNADTTYVLVRLKDPTCLGENMAAAFMCAGT
jgi:hypothetical protein